MNAISSRGSEEFKLTKLLSTLAGVSLLAVASQAQLYSQAPHTPGAAGGNGSSSFQGTLAAGGPMFDREFADDFTVTGAGWSINRVTSNWVRATVSDTNPVTGMDIVFYNKVGGAPGTIAATATTLSTSVLTGAGTYFGRPEIILDSSITAVTLGAGDYFVQIQPLVNHNWFWLTSTPTTAIAGSPAHFRRGPLTSAGTDTTWPASWTATGTAGSPFTTALDGAYALHGSPVPEPATMAALGLGVAALLRRRRSK